MSLKVVLFDFNGVILDDEPIHEQLIQDLMLAENLRTEPDDFQRFCLGRSDRACLQDLFNSRGRVLTEAALNTLVAQKSVAYQQYLHGLESLPLFPGVEGLIQSFQACHLQLGIVSGALRSEIEWVLDQSNLRNVFQVIIAAEDISTSKPSPEGYQRAITQFNQLNPALALQSANCLAIEDSFPGLEAAHNANIPVVGVAHTYPFHMLQRRANWAIDSLEQLEVSRLIQVYSSGEKFGGSPLSNIHSEDDVLVQPHG